jgi:hypothetical protein
MRFSVLESRGLVARANHIDDFQQFMEISRLKHFVSILQLVDGFIYVKEEYDSSQSYIHGHTST